MERIEMIILSVILSYVLGCTTMMIYLNRRFKSVKDMIEDKILINDLLKKEMQNLTCGENSKKPANKNKRRNFRRKPKKQQDK